MSSCALDTETCDINEDDATEQSELEPWVDFIKRITHDIETKLKNLKTDNWVTQARRRKWGMACRILQDGDTRWSTIALKSDPQTMFDGNASHACRMVARPKTRWTDEIVKIARRCYQNSTTWTELMTDGNFWSSHEKEFVYDT